MVAPYIKTTIDGITFHLKGNNICGQTAKNRAKRSKIYNRMQKTSTKRTYVILLKVVGDLDLKLDFP